jgi:hypothetical protein
VDAVRAVIGRAERRMLLDAALGGATARNPRPDGVAAPQEEP